MSNGNSDDQPKIKFIQYHQPALKDGHYRLTVTQTVQPGIEPGKTYQVKQPFVISGERYSLNPQDILSVFPPPDSQGDHGNVLAHVLLRRSTLPWERVAQLDQDDWPWLSVLLFDETEAPAPQIIDLKTLFSDQPASFPKRADLPPDPGEHDEDRVTVIDVPAALLREIAPTGEELALLAHVRQWTTDMGQDIGGEQAVVLGNRLPRRGRTSVAHLVSMERRYQDGKLMIPEDKPVRLVSLKSWRFSCLDERIGGHELNFTGLLRSVEVGKLHLPEKILQQSASVDEKDEAREYLSRGFLPLPHHLRNGQETVSWYHGPLIPDKKMGKSSVQLPARAADALLGFDSRYELYDVSYSAAWELGRLLALQDSSFSLALYHWKRANARQQKEVSAAGFDHLPFKREFTLSGIPETVSNWLSELALLKGVPFNYLVPDERMLPPESLRLFFVDPDWVACLLDGAFSVGRVSDHDHRREQAIYDQIKSIYTRAKESDNTQVESSLVGLLLRSDVVAGWPNLQVDAYNMSSLSEKSVPDNSALTLVRMERLSANVLLCLFDASLDDLTRIRMVDIHQKPEGLHSGVTAGDGLDAAYQKKVRNLSGEERDDFVEVMFRGQAAGETLPSRVLQIKELALALQQVSNPDTELNAAAFALQMIEGVAGVRFVIELPRSRGA